MIDEKRGMHRSCVLMVISNYRIDCMQLYDACQTCSLNEFIYGRPV